jgi:ketosteroid isomerase-like protein
MPHANEELIHRFYAAFARRDAAGMGACYAPDVHFRDPAFGDLQGDRARGMWRMLCERGTDLKIEHSQVKADDTTGSAHWEAWYTFSGTGKKVHNVIDARFRFADGKIVDHVDTFSFPRWSRQALGVTGLLLGWTPLLQRKVQTMALRGLDKFLGT